MKIAAVSASRIPSLTANSMQVMKACQALNSLGHDLTLLVPDHREAGVRSADSLASLYGLAQSFPVEWLPHQPRWRRYDFAARSVRRSLALRAEILYTWLIQAALAGLLAGLPVILELHGPPEGRFGPLLFRLFLSLPGLKRILPITQALADMLRQHYSRALQPASVVISPNGVDLQRYQNLPDPPSARRQLGLAERFTAVYTGHFYSGRGMDMMVRLAQRFPHVQFLWVGGTTQAVTEWRARLVDSGVQNVFLTGFVENRLLPGYQAAGEVLLMPYERLIQGSSGGNSASYASPMKMFEYMACRRFILSSDLPVIREVLNPNNACLCPPDELDAWVKGLQSALEQPALREQTAGQAWQDVQAFTWEMRARRALEGFLR
jgi:glycosyltransferase involved in cell wall biosynthesis